MQVRTEENFQQVQAKINEVAARDPSKKGMTLPNNQLSIIRQSLHQMLKERHMVPFKQWKTLKGPPALKQRLEFCQNMVERADQFFETLIITDRNIKNVNKYSLERSLVCDD